MNDSEPDDLARALEATLFAATEPMTIAQLRQYLGDAVDIAAALDSLAADYAGRGVNLVEVAGKWRFLTASDLGYVFGEVKEEPRKLSKAALETLAVVAYHQPVTRAVTVPVEDEANVELVLARTSTTAGLVATPRSRVAPIAMTAIGAVGAASVLAIALLPDSCERRDAAAACIERRVPNGAALRAYAVVSGVLLVGGLVWAVRVRNHNERSTTVSVGPGSIHIGGSF